ncbi:MAG: hypothetical protein ACRDBY_05115 [Cetobacterium sp.]
MNKYIKVTRETEKEVLEVLDKLGYKWAGGQVATGYSAFDYNSISEMYIRIEGTLTCIRYTPDCDEITLEQLKVDVYKTISDIKDLHTLENKDRTLRTVLRHSVGHILLLDISNEFAETILTIYKLSQDVIDMLNHKGFNLVYKPPRTKEDIFEEIEKLAELPNENEGRYRVYFGHPRIDEFNVRKIDTSAISYPRIKGIKKEDAERLCNELNNLKEVK